MAQLLNRVRHQLDFVITIAIATAANGKVIRQFDGSTGCLVRHITSP
jgi:hypothetical protein